ncbi:hypothetical protein WH221_12805 [Chryseobacterium culicis]|uniref:YD repeat-containing protein n=1 Tax=Chryseobacterium culicis TaxID=680127 RepID=A0A2S9D2S9_CHRCI|nr:hypothetical protein [Chryseobacterium culicis]PRB87075.1 hypothetical protein CQ022_12785 [Chryseobacterium culicis]PRB92828.1 hypothetical protein CQ033_06455 [Chryseobacterium culicis]
MTKTILLTLIFTFTISFSQNKNNINYFPPEKVENSLDQNFLLTTFYALSYPETGFSITHPVGSAKIYEEYLMEKNPQDAKKLLAEIHFNKSGKLNSIQQHSDGDHSIIIYNEKALISHIIDHHEEYDNIREYTYDTVGNLISLHDYNKEDGNLDFRSYTEYHYYIENGNTIVQTYTIEKHTGLHIEKRKLTFDKQQRMIKEERSLRIPNRAELKYERIYRYDHPKFPEKVTKKETHNFVGDNYEREIFEYNDNGDLIYTSLDSEPGKSLYTEKTTFSSKNQAEKITIYSKGLKGSMKEEKKTHNLLSYDDSGNIIYDKEIRKEEDNVFTKNTYQFDEYMNWTELLVQKHIYLPQYGKKDDESFDSYSKYIREISYSGFEEPHSAKLIDTVASEYLKKEVLAKSKFYEQIKNTKQ